MSSKLSLPRFYYPLDKIVIGDPRMLPLRPDLAAEFLRSLGYQAPKFTAGRLHHSILPLVNLYDRPDMYSPLSSQLLYGEGFMLYEIHRGWAWGQSLADHYVGYVPYHGLAPGFVPPDAVITLPHCLVFDPHSPKTRKNPLMPLQPLYYQSGVRWREEIAAQDFLDNQWITLANHAHILSEALRPLNRAYAHIQIDIVAEAKRFCDAPYLWGGRSVDGLDCSALIQLVLQAAGVPCPRDSDLQRAILGISIPRAELQAGDLVFFPGHVGMMIDENFLIHANQTHQRVTINPLEEVVKSFLPQYPDPILACKRLKFPTQ